MTLGAEDGSIGSHDTHIGVSLHACHINGFGKGCIQIAQSAKFAGNGILTRINAIAVAVIMIVLVILLTEPCGAAVVVLIHCIHRISVAPGGVVCSPRLYIAYQNHIGILGLYGIIELFVALCVVVALVVIVIKGIIVVLVTYLYEAQTERFRMSVGCSHSSERCTDVPIAILYQIKCLLNKFA